MLYRECFCVGNLAFFVVVLILSVNAQQFYTSTRYGKRDETQGLEESGRFVQLRNSRVPANLHVAPRNDRFFLGSRYGKRSDNTLNRDEDLARLLEQLNRFRQLYG